MTSNSALKLTTIKLVVPVYPEAPSRISYSVQATLAPNPEVIEVEMTRAGRFILATNVLDAIELSADDALTEYKDQQSNERGFRFLKDPLFFTSSIFVKSPLPCGSFGDGHGTVPISLLSGSTPVTSSFGASWRGH